MRTSRIFNFIKHYKVILIVSLMETIRKRRNQMESASQRFMERIIPTCIVFAVNGIFSNVDPFKANITSFSTRHD